VYTQPLGETGLAVDAIAGELRDGLDGAILRADAAVKHSLT
jgi:hypothetical protein